ncbi:hypothetical protein [Fulvivirga sedimenti]|uniref:Uncharacterized protein n=1 Tax=Fulvivirga sedimenti TaxID=2879465 RepID=A0A9X1HXZ3_9BACT|nr:hypothetical protein [Fulvivirga sedimenti]MCA6078509.1 hypothetical protein [Fulvivirga sedimenti]
MMRKLILYTYFLCGCFAVSKLHSQGRAKDDFFFSDRQQPMDSLQKEEESSVSLQLEDDRMKSEAFVFTDSFQHKIELEKIIRDSSAKLEKMLSRINEKQMHLNSLHDKGILTNSELELKNVQIKRALMKCEELRIHIQGAKGVLSQLNPGS